MQTVPKAYVWAHWLLVVLLQAVSSPALLITNLTTWSNIRSTAYDQFCLQVDGHHSKAVKAAWTSNTTIQSCTKCDVNTSQVLIRCDIRVPVRLPKIAIRTVKSLEILQGYTQVWGGEDMGSLLRRSVWPRICNGYEIISSRSMQTTAQDVIRLHRTHCWA